MPEVTNILEMRGISKSFPGVQALNEVSLNIRPGTVHALMGENGAGKSTLMKCLFGMYQVDAGTIVLNGEAKVFANSKQALDAGISMIHQELHPIPHRSVMENLWLGRYPTHGIGPFKFVDHKKMFDDTVKLFADLQMDLDPRLWVTNLSVSKIQSLEIAKAVSYHSRIIIMDEPTSSLSEKEVGHLFQIIRKLKADGVSIIYISHKMEEILQIADEVTIMRDGRQVGTYPSSELTTDLIISRMVGRDLTHRFPPRANIPGEVLMEVKNFTSPNPKSFKDASFELKRGEILGVSGLVGAQRTELMEAIFGMRPVASGQILMNGVPKTIRTPADAQKNKMALLTEERRTTGIFSILPVFDNTLMAHWRHYVRRLGLLDLKSGEADVQERIRTLRVKTPSSSTLIQNLSGGNQQKVVFSRWLLTDPEILILDEPTRGIDVGAKYEIYTLITELAQRGKAIIMISSELPEILGMSDRIMVMCEGRVTGIVPGAEATQEKIMHLSTQFMTQGDSNDKV
ncbi:sugar ABC transporter ATP-binding protein [Silvimonas soli]|uniref:sugar ABC transporter ATP-binding protein n=1 Tax=Silvimonas soli TaxID=2980100 RepID=UPI0024B3ABC9|nr:sugar ABC transporter ATP-binding protein [Silvimonas soli]